MKKNKFISGLLLGCAVFAVAGGVAGWKTANVSANNSQSAIEEPTMFAAIQGAQVRKTVDTSGIRFSTIVNDEWWGTATADKTVEYGYLVAKNATEELTEQNAVKVPAQVLLEVDADEDGTTDYLRFNYAITNIPETEYETLVSARSYVTIDGTTQYGETQTRSIAKVAASAFAANEADPDGVIAGYINEIAEDVNFAAETQKLNKAVITVDTAGLAVETQPAGYAVKLTSNNEDVAKIVNGKIVPQAKEGKATITAQFGTQQSDTYELTVVSYSATLGGKAIADDALLKVKVADGYFASVNAATENSEFAQKLVVKEYDGTNETDVTATAVAYEYSVAGVVEVEQGTISGGTVNGTTTVSAKVDGYEVASFDVEGWTEITTIAQMNELSLATWKLRDNKVALEAVLDGKYVLGNDLNYNGAYVLPIANTRMDDRIDFPAGVLSYDTWVWEEILSPITADWSALNFNTATSKFNGSNPLNLPFTGIFDGNGYAIQNAQILDVNYLFANRTSNTTCYAGGGCFIGKIGEDGILRNINFEELRWRKYYGTKAQRQTELTDEKYQIYFGSSKLDTKFLPYTDSVLNTNDAALVRTNAGTITDVRISTKTTYQKAAYGNFKDSGNLANSKAVAQGVGRNDGLVNALVVELLYGELDWLRHDDFVEGTDKNLSSALMAETAIFYGVNQETGVVQNSVFLSNLKSGGKGVLCDEYFLAGTTKKHQEKYALHCGGDDVLSTDSYKLNLGTLTNCAKYHSRKDLHPDKDGTCDLLDVFAEANYDASAFNTKAWDTTTMTMKKGVWAF